MNEYLYKALEKFDNELEIKSSYRYPAYKKDALEKHRNRGILKMHAMNKKRISK